MHAKQALTYAVIVSIVLTGALAGGYYYHQQQVMASLNYQMALIASELVDTREILSAQINVESASIRDELDQRSDFLLSKIVEVESKSAEEIAKVEAEAQMTITGIEQKLKDVQISSADFSAIIEDVIPSIVFIRTDTGSGSGVIIDRDGLVLTNWHVVEDAKYGQANDFEEQIYGILILGHDAKADLAVIELQTEETLKPLSFADSDFVHVGQKVIAVGNPGGYSFSVTEGIISAVHRLGPDGTSYLQHDVAINPGSSGGPLINSNGDIVGINTLKAEGMEGIGFAIESNKAKRVYQEILAEAIEEGKYEPE